MKQQLVRESFIPCTRQKLIELCLEDNRFNKQEQKEFRAFCKILAAYYHFKFHSHLENIKKNFAPFNPDYKNTVDRKLESNITTEREKELLDTFRDVLEKANYTNLSQAKLENSFQENSLFDLQTEIDFNDFSQMLCYSRGDTEQEIKVKKFWWKVPKKVEVFERVVLLIKFKDERHFKDKPTNKEELNFNPGKIYVYLYKNLSKADVEFIFPNIKMSMTWKDRLLFGIPAIGAGISLIVRVLPQLLLILGVIIYVTLGKQPIEELRVTEDSVRNITPLLVTVLSLCMTLGGFAFKQYNTYKTKKMRFQKRVTETLFFRNIASNIGVFQNLIDLAEEEECKEIILVYYHLLTSPVPLTPPQLDEVIEVWMEKKLGKQVDFDIDSTIESLEEIKIKNKNDLTTTSLIDRNSDNYCQALTLERAKQVIDRIWDNIFEYS